ncbi:VanZ family protein [Clostridium septicum]|uniref:VanZ family protein n=1 Tax=Clostridium septicum TaxID=1504 RepID=UPI00272E8DD8|nr:VanZ family protein [Clostridium septicum]WLF69246.1 VanZ family protein [Clostridium septicum]
MVQGCIYDLRTVLMLGLPIWIIIRIATLIVKKKSGEKISVGKEIITNIFVIYCLLLIGVTLFPIEIMFGDGLSELRSIYTFKQRLGINIIPLRDYIYGIIRLRDSDIGYFFFIRSIVGNIILLVPFIGYLLMYKKKLRTAKNVIVTSLLISFSIEILQLIENITYLSGMSVRTVNIDDLILNTLGGILAYYFFKFIYKSKLRVYLNME